MQNFSLDSWKPSPVHFLENIFIYHSHDALMDKLFSCHFFPLFAALIPTSLCNLLLCPERRNPSLHCFSSWTAFMSTGLIEKWKMYQCAHKLCSVSFFFLFPFLTKWFNSFAINSTTKRNVMLCFKYVNISIPVNVSFLIFNGWTSGGSFSPLVCAPDTV